jgi:hypothetical protein
MEPLYLACGAAVLDEPKCIEDVYFLQMFVKKLCTFCEKISFKLMLFELRISF